MARADASEFGFGAEIPSAAWFRQPPPRQVDTGRLVRASYRSRAGRSLAGFGVVSGIALLVVSWFARDSEPGSAILLLGFGLFCVLMILLPVLPARRLAHALRHGVVRAGTVTNVEIEPVGSGRTIDSIAHGLARGRLRVPGLADDGVEFESDSPWATRIVEGSRMDVLVDPARRRVLWILGPAADDAP